MDDADPEWKRIQKKTFTRWCNEHLKVQMMSINDLATDLCDGVRLIVLVEILSQKRVGRYIKKPRIDVQRIENVELALDFITKKERIRLLNIGSGDIVNGNLKLILGLIWTLILHYQISIGFGLDDPSAGPKVTPKQAMMNFLQGQLPDQNFKNMTTDWNDGTLLAKLVNATAPGLCPEAAEMSPENALENANHAMALADEWLGVPQVIAPEDLIKPNVDELSMLTYLSQFPQAELKPGAPVKSRANPAKVKVFGPGVQKDGVDTNVPVAEFTIDVKEAGEDKASATVKSPEGPIECIVVNNKDGTYSCSYVPTVPGTYIVTVTFAGKPAAKSPYYVNVVTGIDPSACIACGPGVEGTDLKAESPTEFWVETANAGQGKLGTVVKGPKGPIPSSKVSIKEETEDKYHVCYTPEHPGQYTVEVTYANLHIQNSPFRVRVAADLPVASKCRAEGPGIQSTGVEIKKQTWFDVYTVGAGRDELMVHIKGPQGTVDVQKVEKEKGVYHFTYTPTQSGEYVITVKYGDEQIPGSRFRVQVEPPTDTRSLYRIIVVPGVDPGDYTIDIDFADESIPTESPFPVKASWKIKEPYETVDVDDNGARDSICVEEKVQYPIYIDEEESERLKHLEIEVPCDFRYAGCKVTLPLKNMADHMKENSVAHNSILTSYFQQKLRRVTDENAQLKKRLQTLHGKVYSICHSRKTQVFVVKM